MWLIPIAILVAACTAPATPAANSETTDGCGHDVDASLVKLGFNRVVDAAGAAKKPQGKPLQAGDRLEAVSEEVTAPNEREYARVASYIMPIRDALMCDFKLFSLKQWQSLTEILTLNGIKTTQNLSGTPKEQFYSTDGIYEHLLAGPDFHPMMKYLEEAELELKCLAFVDFDFVNPEGDDHCATHGLEVGSGLVLPGN